MWLPLTMCILRQCTLWGDGVGAMIPCFGSARCGAWTWHWLVLSSPLRGLPTSGQVYQFMLVPMCAYLVQCGGGGGSRVPLGHPPPCHTGRAQDGWALPGSPFWTCDVITPVSLHSVYTCSLLPRPHITLQKDLTISCEEISLFTCVGWDRSVTSWNFRRCLYVMRIIICFVCWAL